jgi:D-psicose/D-tagatose/L-ribulose 3-epimerase
MKFSINTVLFVSPFKNQHTKPFAHFKSWGYDAVELLVEDPNHIKPAKVKWALHQQNLKCGSIAAAALNNTNGDNLLIRFKFYSEC